MTWAIPSQDPPLLVTPQTYLCSELLREGEPEVPSGEVIRTEKDTKKTMAAQEIRLWNRIGPKKLCKEIKGDRVGSLGPLRTGVPGAWDLYNKLESRLALGPKGGEFLPELVGSKGQD